MALLSGAKQGIVVGYFVFVAQLDSASDSDSEGRGFESRQTQTERSPETGFSFFVRRKCNRCASYVCAKRGKSEYLPLRLP